MKTVKDTPRAEVARFYPRGHTRMRLHAAALQTRRGHGKEMKQDNAVYTLGTWRLGALLGLMAACAGSDTPARTTELENQIAVIYAGASPTGAAAAGGGSGIGGSAATGSGGSTVGGGGSSMTGAGGGSIGGCDGFALLETKCGGGSCHGQPSSRPGGLSNFALDESTAAAFANQESDQCSDTDNASVFDPDNPAASLVIKKIIYTTDCGKRMPLGATTQALTEAELTCVKTWIGTL